jgi:phosphatidate cytidylyltransferase
MDNTLKVRILTSIVFVIAVFGLLFSGNLGQMLLFIIISIGSTYELLKMAKASLTTITMVSLAILILYLLSYQFPPSEYIITLITAILCLLYLYISYSLLISKKHPSSIIISLSVLYPGACAVMYASSIKDINIQSIAGLLTGTILLIWLNDAFAYLVGRKIGKKPLNALISPNKTMEGFYAGGIATVLGGLIMTFIIPNYSMITWVCVALLVWITGVVGDLVQSALKRKYKVKDSGNIMPGHGGFYDRFDSLIFTLPFVYLLMKIIN